MDFKIDMKQAEQNAKQFDLLPPATYKVRVDSAEDITSASGTEGVHFKFKTLDTETERTINYFLYQSKIVETIIFKMSLCFGVKTPKSAQDFTGKVGVIKYLNKDRDGDKVGDINPFSGFIPKSDDDDEAEVTAPVVEDKPF